MCYVSGQTVCKKRSPSMQLTDFLRVINKSIALSAAVWTGTRRLLLTESPAVLKKQLFPMGWRKQTEKRSRLFTGTQTNNHWLVLSNNPILNLHTEQALKVTLGPKSVDSRETEWLKKTYGLQFNPHCKMNQVSFCNQLIHPFFPI